MKWNITEHSYRCCLYGALEEEPYTKMKSFSFPSAGQLDQNYPSGARWVHCMLSIISTKGPISLNRSIAIWLSCHFDQAQPKIGAFLRPNRLPLLATTFFFEKDPLGAVKSVSISLRQIVSLHVKFKISWALTPRLTGRPCAIGPGSCLTVL